MKRTKVAEFIGVLTKPFELDAKLKQLGSADKTLPRLYLSEQTLKAFDAYESILISAAMMMKLLTVPLREKGNLVKSGVLAKTVIDLVPASKDGFDKYGDSYACHWSTYFHDQVLTLLRHEVSGADDMAKATKSAESLAIDSRRAQLNIRSTLQAAGLPESLLSANQASVSSVVEAAKG